MTKKRYLAELQELKDLFAYCLPVGEHQDKANEYFNSLQTLIDTNDYHANPEPIPRECFPESEPDVEYTYLKDALPTEQRSVPELRPHRQIMDYASDMDQREVSQCDGEVAHDHAPVPECEGKRDTEYGENFGDDPSW
jgi:hypothetical protein